MWLLLTWITNEKDRYKKKKKKKKKHITLNAPINNNNNKKKGPEELIFSECAQYQPKEPVWKNQFAPNQCALYLS